MDKQIKISLTRESVSQGDDVFAPNKKVIYFSLNRSIADLTTEVLAIHYLANIFGDRATWIMKNEQTKIAVIAQQWTNAKFLIDENLAIDNLKKSGSYIHIHFDYLAQQNPSTVYENLIADKN